MSRQFIRDAKLLIKSDNIEIDLSTLAFKFETTQAILGIPKTLKIRIYNVAPQTIQSIINEGLRIQLDAGYIDSISTIFSGQIRQISTGKENGVDSFVDIQASDNDTFFKDGFVSKTVAAGSTGNSRLYALNQMTDTGAQEILLNTKDEGTQLPRGRVYHGKSANYMDNIASQKGASFHIENGQIVITDINRYTTEEKFIIDRNTGMIGLPQQTLSGIQVKCLLNPNIKIGGPILLDNESIQIQQQNFGYSEEAKWKMSINPLNKDGIYKVIGITHEGEIRGTPWYTNIICYDVNSFRPAQILMSAGSN
jgi:hypothetical protein